MGLAYLYEKLQRMTTAYYKKHLSAFFEGKVGIVLTDFKSRGGLEFKAGEKVFLFGKTSKGGFKVGKTDKTYDIVGVKPEQIDLLYEQDNLLNGEKKLTTTQTLTIIKIEPGNFISVRNEDGLAILKQVADDREWTTTQLLEAIDYGFNYHRDSMNDDVAVPVGNKLQWLIGKFIKPEKQKEWLDNYNKQK